MKHLNLLIGSLGLGLGAAVCLAEEPASVETLQQRLQQTQDSLDRLMREQQAQIDGLKKQIEELSSRPPVPTIVAETNLAASTAPPPEAGRGWSPADPIRIGSGRAYMDIGMVATFVAGSSTASDIEGGTELGGHDPNQRGFTVQGVELNLQGAVDPYFRGNANLLYQIDASGESLFELEEAWLETVSLPWNLQLRAGQHLTEFGRINTQHPHAWAFVDVPLVSGRLLGPDGLRNPGARLSWLAPTPFYSELYLGVQNSQGETAYSFRADHEGDLFLGRPAEVGDVSSLGDLLYTARYTASFDLTDSQTVLAGASAAFGPNSQGSNTDTEIYGVDLYWKWKPARSHGGFPFVSWQTEAMARRSALGAWSGEVNGGPYAVPSESITDWGVYSQVLYGFHPGWVAGFRGEYAGRTDPAQYESLYGNDPNRLDRWRLSPNLTWYPTEFSKIRLQYNFDERDQIGADHSVWLQFEFLLGAHAAHKF